MTTALPGDRLLGRAFLGSLALHLVLIALIPPLVASEGPGVETISFVRIVQLAPPRPTPRPAHAEAATAPVAAPIARAAPPHAVQHHLARHPAASKAASPLPRAPVVAAITRPGTSAATVTQTAPPIVAASATPLASASESPPNHQQIGGMVPLGVDEPSPVLERSVRDALVALGVHVTLTVDVDAQGHTVSVAFQPPLDPTMEEKIRSMLASASWDPAVCGAGTTCDGSAVIKL